MKALDNLNRKGRNGGGRAGKRRSPSPYSDYSRGSYSDDSFKRKGRKSRSASLRKGKRDSRSPASKSGGSFRQHSVDQGSLRGEIDPPSNPVRVRSMSAGSQGPKNPEENGNGHVVEEKNLEPPAEVQPPTEVIQKE